MPDNYMWWYTHLYAATWHISSCGLWWGGMRAWLMRCKLNWRSHRLMRIREDHDHRTSYDSMTSSCRFRDHTFFMHVNIRGVTVLMFFLISHSKQLFCAHLQCRSSTFHLKKKLHVYISLDKWIKSQGYSNSHSKSSFTLYKKKKKSKEIKSASTSVIWL